MDDSPLPPSNSPLNPASTVSHSPVPQPKRRLPFKKFISVSVIGGAILLGLGLVFLSQKGLERSQETRSDASAGSVIEYPVSNSSFETGPYGVNNGISSWEVGEGMNQAETYIVNGNDFPSASDGTYYAKVVRGTQEGRKYVASQWMRANSDLSGRTFILQLSIKSHSNPTTLTKLSVQRWHSDANRMWQAENIATGDPLPITKDWATYTYSVTMPPASDAQSSDQFRILLSGNEDGYIEPIYYDNVRLFISAYPTDTPIPLQPSIPNGSFESGQLQPWEKGQGIDVNNSFIVDGNTAPNPTPMAGNGRYYAKVTRKADTRALTHITSDWIDMGNDVSGKYFKLSFDVRSHNPTASISGISVQRQPKWGATDPWEKTSTYLPIIQATAAWQTITQENLRIPVSTNGNNSSKVRVVLEGNNENYVQPIYYDDVTLEIMDAPPTLTPPPAPDSLTINNLQVQANCEADTVNLTWDHATAKDTQDLQYQIVYCNAGATTCNMTTGNHIESAQIGEVNQYQFTDVDLSRSYLYKVRAKIVNGNAGEWSQQTIDHALTCTEPTLPPTTLGRVTNVTAVPDCQARKVNLQWNALANAQSYEISTCKGSSCTNWSLLAQNITSNNYVHASASAGLHRYKVRGKNQSGVGAYSTIAQARISSTCPDVTPSITATPAATSTPTPISGRPPKGTITSVEVNCSAKENVIAWAQIPSASKYQLQFCKGNTCGGTDYSNLITATQNYTGTSFTHDELTAGLFRYRMRGINSVDVGPWSDPSTGRLPAVCPTVTPTATLTPTDTPDDPDPSFTPVPPALAGDFDEDGNVSLAELQRVMDAYGQTGNIPENVNADNEVNLLDVTIVLANFLR